MRFYMTKDLYETNDGKGQFALSTAWRKHFIGRSGVYNPEAKEFTDLNVRQRPLSFTTGSTYTKKNTKFQLVWLICVGSLRFRESDFGTGEGVSKSFWW